MVMQEYEEKQISLSRFSVSVLVSAALLLTSGAPVSAGDAALVSRVSPVKAAYRNGDGDKVLHVMAGKTVVLDFRDRASRVAVANKDVADVVIATPEQLLVNGISAGETSLVAWSDKGNYSVYNIVVTEQAREQVMLEITVAEVNKAELEKRGIDIRAMGGQFGALSQAGGAAPVFGQHAPQANQPPFPVSLGSGLSLAVVDFQNDIAGFIKATNDDNVARILAEPKLLARSGEKASFLSGGEIPILISEDQQTSVSYKEFGVKVDFVPSVAIDGTIDLDVFAEVSEPDFSQGVELFGFTVPAFVSRRAQTNVSLSSGRSLVIAGLLKTSERDFTSKVPVLGSVPILGAFFRRSEKEKFETELIMVVKPVLLGSDGEDGSAAVSQGDGAVDFIRNKTEGTGPR